MGQTYVAYGVRFGIRSNSVEIMNQLESVLPDGVRVSKRQKADLIFSFLYGGENNSSLKRFNVVYRNGDLIDKALGKVEWLVRRFESDLHQCIAELAATRFFIHAGVVEWNGYGIMTPARSDRGKSTLVRKLVRWLPSRGIGAKLLSANAFRSSGRLAK